MGSALLDVKDSLVGQGYLVSVHLIQATFAVICDMMLYKEIFL